MSSTEQNCLTEQLSNDGHTSDSLHLLLNNISSLNQAVELQAVVQESMRVIQDVMSVEASSLMLLDEVSGELIVSISTGPVQKEVKGERISEGEGIGNWVIENEEPYYSNDLQNDEIFAGDLVDDFTSKNILCVPLKDKGQTVFGVLQAINRLDDRGFEDGDITVFQALADHVANAIERTRDLERVQSQLQEKEMMLTEVHHRLKNNLSTITSLIEMELMEVADEAAKQVLQKTASRISSMTEVHDFLYQSSSESQVDLKSYLERLSQKISNTLSLTSQEIAIDIQATPVKIDTERAMSCGLLLNELIVNCYKHAFEQKSEDCLIIIQLDKMDNDIICLRVMDNGIGIEDEFSMEDSASTGAWLIDVLVRRLDATIDVNGTDGTTFAIKFKK